MTPVIAYLESLEYTGSGWCHGLPYPLMDFRAPFGTEMYEEDADEHDDSFCDADFLCTGDGFRWNSALAELRFA